MLSFSISPGGNLKGEFTVSGDKSISHRAIILGSIAEGVTRVSGFLTGADCLATLQAFRAMGVEILQSSEDALIIHGVGLQGLKAPATALDLGNSGTSMRLLGGLLVGQIFSSRLIGDASLCKRPMSRLVEPLRQMGAEINLHQHNYPPLDIVGNKPLQGLHYTMPIASAQVKSALLLAGLYAKGETIIEEPAITRDHTERLLKAFGAKLSISNQQIILKNTKRLVATDLMIPADISSAAFFIVGALIAPGSEIILKNIGINPSRTGVLSILQKMGANIQLINQRQLGAEPIADIVVKYSRLKGIDIPVDLVSRAIDEFPAIFIAAACAKGVTRLKGAAELRVKESDRIQVMVEGLRALQIAVAATDDGMIIQGGRLQGGIIDSYGDHRVAMAFAMAGLVAEAEIMIQHGENVSTSFPSFVELAQLAGLTITQKYVH